jgi:hypothetical protein
MVVCRFPTVVVQAVSLLALLALAGGCQSGKAVSSRQLIEHQAFIDFSGLDSVKPVPVVNASIAAPRRWQVIPGKPSAIYSHQQWRSPSSHTGVGIVNAHLPFPLSTKAVVWFAKQEYTKQNTGGKLLGEWTDELGRYWFEAENDKYHVRGYVVVKGFSAWVVYFGYRAKYAPNLAEISTAARAAETAVPMVDEPAKAPASPIARTKPAP